MILPPEVCPEDKREHWTDPLWTYHYACAFARACGMQLPEPHTTDEAAIWGQYYAHSHPEITPLDAIY